MITSEIDSLTGLPAIKETREDLPFRAIPRTIGKLAAELDAMEEGTPWYPVTHEFNAHVLMRVRCLKCGADVKGWRMALDRHGKPIEIAGRPGVAFLPLPNLTQTLLAVRLTKMNKTVAIGAVHCLDCVIAAQDSLHVFACAIGGMDAVLSHAVRQKSTRMSPDLWATFLFRFSGAETIGPVSIEEATMKGYERVLGPGELITAAHMSLFIDATQRNQTPKGVVVEFQGNEIPVGWAAAPGRPGFIIKL